MIATTKPLLALTAADLMSRDVITVPQEMSLREAAHLLSRNQVSGAPVVDADGHCIGVLSGTDFVRWAEEEGRGAEDGPIPACRYQVKGRLLTGEEAVICTLPAGSCPLQTIQPTTGGRHTAICLEPSGVLSDWQQVTERRPPGTVGHYMTADVVTVGPQTPLPELTQMMIDAHLHRIIVVDAEQRPIGLVASTDVLAAVAYAERRRLQLRAFGDIIRISWTI
jgi:CBS-domain-containing membrane protein